MSKETQQTSNDFILIPYAKVKGEWTLPDQFIRAAFEQMREEGTAATVFFEETVTSANAFLEIMQAKINVAVFVVSGTELRGVAWLNGWAKNYAYGHFCFMKSAHGSTVEMGKQIVDYWMSFPTLEFVLGIVPGFNERAINFVQKIGFKLVGRIPKMVERPQGRTDAVILYLTEEE